MTVEDADQGPGNEALRRLLARAQWSPEHLGDRLNALAATLGLRARLSRRTPRRWVDGEARRGWLLAVPREPWPALVCSLLRERLGEPITPSAVGWASAGPLTYVPADDGLDHPWDVRGALAALASVVDADAMERRHFVALTGLSLTAAAHQWLFDPARVAASLLGQRVDHALVDDLEHIAESHRRVDDAIGGGTLLPAVREQLRLVTAMLDNAAYTEQVGRRLHGVAAEWGRLAGWLAYDANQQAAAQRYYLAALRAAHLSGDRGIGANILGFMSIQAAHSSNPRDAVTLAQSALRAERELTPAVTGSLYGRLAVGAAHAGDAAASLRAQDRAFEALTRSQPANEPSWIYWFTEADARGIAGESMLALDRPREAETHLRRAVGLLGAGFSRDRALWLCDLASARLSSGSVEQACATASEAAVIIRRLNSPRDQRRLTEFRATAAPYARSTAVRDFDAKHRDLLSASRA